MSLKIIVDENINYRILSELQNLGIDTISIIDKYRGMSDEKIINLARQENAVILTRDKDFGELIFSYKHKNTGIILLRYSFTDFDKILEILVSIINDKKESLTNYFTVITKNKIRMRYIH